MRRQGKIRELTTSLCKPHGNSTRTTPRRPTDTHNLPDPVRKQPPSSQTLHRTHRRPHARINLAYAQSIQQLELRPHHIKDRQHREGRRIAFPLLRGAIGIQGSRAERRRPSGSITTSDNVRTNDVELIRVKGFTRPDEFLPPAFCGICFRRSGMGRSG